jgi:hypothetical protein
MIQDALTPCDTFAAATDGLELPRILSEFLPIVAGRRRESTLEVSAQVTGVAEPGERSRTGDGMAAFDQARGFE